MHRIVLTAFNAKYIHPAFGLRYLRANLGEFRTECALLEFDLLCAPVDAAERILSEHPRVVGVSVHIWNLAQARNMVLILRALAPDLCIVLGGPEIGHAPDSEPAVQAADFVVSGEGEHVFREICQSVLLGHQPPQRKRIETSCLRLADITMPYDEYSATDIARRTLYFEATRGCPFSCEYCLSATNPGIRQFPLENTIDALRALMNRGATRFKFLDRSFNADMRTSLPILDFFLSNLRKGLFLHFELVPDLLPDDFLQRIRQFPPDSLHFEIGYQSLDNAVCSEVGRFQDADRATENLATILRETSADVHADLIAGLPGESLEGFASGFDRLARLGPGAIQVNLLKRLPGTAIERHSNIRRMVYSPSPPYEILQNDRITFEDFQRLRRFARYWQVLHNEGHMRNTLRTLWRDIDSPFGVFMALSDWLFGQLGRAHGIALNELLRMTYRNLTEIQGVEAARLAADMQREYAHPSRREPLDLGITAGQAPPQAHGKLPLRHQPEQ